MFAAVVLLGGCSNEQTAQFAAFEAKAGPKIAQGCDYFHKVEASPLVQAGAGAAAIAMNAATGGVPVGGLAISALKGMGDAFCMNGPPADDTTTEADRVAWIVDVGQKLVAEGQKVAAAAK